MSDDIDDVGGGEEGGTPEVPAEILAEAQEQGWVPQDKWTGRPEEWSDAETFVRRGREINPILRKALKKERERTAALEAELRSTGSTVAELREYLAKVEERATANALAQLKRQRTQALSEGDHAAAADLDEQIDELKEAKSAVPAAKAAPANAAPNLANHPEVVAWMAQNRWYSEDNEDLVAFANGTAVNVANRLRAQGQPFTPATVLEQVTERVKKAFPQYFNPGSGAMFESGGSPSGSTRSASVPPRKGAGFATLPKSAQSQFQRFYDAGYYVNVKTGKPLDLAAAQEEYFKEYE